MKRAVTATEKAVRRTRRTVWATGFTVWATGFTVWATEKTVAQTVKPLWGTKKEPAAGLFPMLHSKDTTKMGEMQIGPGRQGRDRKRSFV